MFKAVLGFTMSFILIQSPAFADSNRPRKKTCTNLFTIPSLDRFPRAMTFKKLNQAIEIMIDGFTFFRVQADQQENTLILEWQRYADLYVIRDFINTLLAPKPLMVSAPYLVVKNPKPVLSTQVPLKSEAMFDSHLKSNLSRADWSQDVTYVVEDDGHLIAHLTATLTSPQAPVDLFVFAPNWKLTFLPDQLSSPVFVKALTTLMDKATTSFEHEEIRIKFFSILNQVAKDNLEVLSRAQPSKQLVSLKGP